MTKYKNYKAAHINNSWCVTASTDEQPESGLIVARVPQHIRYPKVVAETIAESLNRNKTKQLIDLI